MTDPTVDSDETHYAAMPSFDSSDGFTPSLPTLINRPADSDAQSVSDIESISNGETVSDTADDFEIVDMYEQPLQEEEDSDEDIEGVTMSNRTITPSRFPLSRTISPSSPDPTESSP